MKENVTKELETLKTMLNNWKKGYLTWASPDGDNDHILLEFREDIDAQIMPYITRLLKTEYLTQAEATEFMDYCYGEVEELKKELAEATS